VTPLYFDLPLSVYGLYSRNVFDMSHHHPLPRPRALRPDALRPRPEPRPLRAGPASSSEDSTRTDCCGG
jgi:hypothetical protein